MVVRRVSAPRAASLAAFWAAVAAGAALALAGAADGAPVPVFGFPGFCSTGSLQFTRSAGKRRVAAALTDERRGSIGGMFVVEPVAVAGGFTTEFTFTATRPAAAKAGHGFALVLQSLSPALIKEGGEGMGYSGMKNAVALEFDVASTGRDRPAGQGPAGQHVSLHWPPVRGGRVSSNESADSSLPHALPAGTDMADGKPHTARVEYAPGSATLTATLDGGAPMVFPLNLTERISLIQAQPGSAFVGFTSACDDDYFGAQSIQSWKWWRPAAEGAGCAVGFGGPECEPFDSGDCDAPDCRSCAALPSCCATCGGGRCEAYTGANRRSCTDPAKQTCAASSPDILWAGVAIALLMFVAFAAGLAYYCTRVRTHPAGLFGRLNESAISELASKTRSLPAGYDDE